MKIKPRQSNIELLRILAMLLIIDVHYFASCDAGAFTLPGTGEYQVYHVMESLGICGVDIFVLITGYFSSNQTTIKIRKIFNLLLDIAFWAFTGYMLCLLFGWEAWNWKSLVKKMFPIIFGGRWFIRSYIVLLCLIPFLNCVVSSLAKGSYRKMLVILGLLFSAWPSFLPNPPLDDYGYSFVHFTFLYLIAGYLRLHLNKRPSKACCLLAFAVSALAVYVSSLLGIGEFWAYSYVFVITAAVSLFLMFMQIDLQSKSVNSLASCAFGIFLIHTDGFFSELIYERLFHCSDLMRGGNAWLYLLSVAVCIPVFYMVGYLLESIKKKLFAVSLDRIVDRIPFLNHVVTIESRTA